jgi:hypothetical protein
LINKTGDSKMKVMLNSQLLTIGAFQVLLGGVVTTAFSISGPLQARRRPNPSFVALHSAVGEKTSWDLASVASPTNYIPRCEGQSRKTFDFPNVNQDVVQLAMNTEGRPMDAEVQLWIGPDWTPFKLKVFSEDGQKYPVQSLIGTRKKSAQVEVRNLGPMTLPFNAACSYAKPPLAEVRTKIPETEEARRVQGAGAVYSFPLEYGKAQARVFLKTDTRQLHARVELLNGPNNVKQKYEVFTNNGVLNSLYVVFETPGGSGYTIRITNQAPVEFPAYAYITQF